MLNIISVISPLFLIIFGSAIFQRVFGKNNNWGGVLNEYAFKVGFPALIFSALSQTNFNLDQELPTVFANTGVIIIGFLLALTISKLLKFKKSTFLTLIICFVFGNVAYLGLPVLTSVYGEGILPRTSLVIAIYLFWIFTIGLGVLEYSVNHANTNVIKKVIKNLIKNPLLIAVVAGVFVGHFNLTMPTPIQEAFKMISASVTPIVLIVIGLFIGNSKIGKLSQWFPIVLFSLFTLILFPGVIFVGISLLGLDPSLFRISILEAAMPLAITPFALADTYKLDKTFIARSIVLSTILSVLTIPLWISLIA